MTERSYTVNFIACTAFQFARATALAEIHVVKHLPCLVGQVNRLRPHGILCSPLCLAVASINHIDKIYRTVIIEVVAAEINIKISVGHRTCVNHQIDNVLVQSVMTHFSRQRHRTYHIKFRFKQPCRLVCKIIPYAPRGIRSIVAFLIGQSVIHLIDILTREFHVGIFGQDNQPPDLSSCRKNLLHCSRSQWCLGHYPTVALCDKCLSQPCLRIRCQQVTNGISGMSVISSHR